MALESVEARIYIQGVAVFVVSPDSSRESQKVEVLIPNQDEAKAAGIHTCEHRAIVQYRHIEDDRDNEPLQLDGKRLRILSDSEEMDLVAADGSIRGMPHLSQVLKHTDDPALNQPAGNPGLIDPDIMANPFGHRRVLANLTLDQGVLNPAAAFETRYKIPRSVVGKYVTGLFSNTIVVELGWVKTFELEIADRETGEVIEVVDLASTRGLYDEANVWIRNFCELTPKPWFPEPPSFRGADDGGREDERREDQDFILNYALVENLPHLIESTTEAGESLPVPILETSWLDGDPIGLENRKCAPAQGDGGG